MNEREILAKRAALANQARAMLDACEAEHRDFSQEEQNNYDAIFAEIAKLDQKLENVRKLDALEGVVEIPAAERPGNGRSASPVDEALRRAQSAWLRTGAVSPEFRALQADGDAAGGFYTQTEQFISRLIQAVDDQTFIRQWATIMPLTQAQSLGAASLEADPADADWTSELKIGGEDSSMTFGKRELSPKPLGKLLKVSNKLLRLTPDVDTLVIRRLAYKFGITFEKAAMSGSGSNQPLGVFTASNDGISTSRDVSTGNTATSIQTDGLLEAKYSLKSAYWPRARWIFHRDAVKQLAKLQDDQGHYLWQPSIVLGQPDMLYGVPLFASEYAPNTFTTGLYVGIIGDFSFYWIADALTFTMQRLAELYAATNQTGFIGRLESDGMPVLEEAFVRVKLA